jgi:dTDP-4-amino-4,6-dideoxygalactose transaminase
VTLHGRVESLDKVRDICETHGLRFIIDAAQSHLGTLKGIPQTNFSDAATLSFYPGKNLGALGEGGAILTNSPEIKEKLMLMRDWGAREKYNHTVWGGNFRLEPLQASFLRIKLRELANWTQDRKRIAEIYRDRLNSDLLMKPISEDGSHVFHIFSIVVNNRTEFCHKMTQNQIGFGFHYPRAIHQQSAYRERVKKPFGLSNSEYLANTTLSLPIFPGQSDFEIEMVIDIANSGLRN